MRDKILLLTIFAATFAVHSHASSEAIAKDHYNRGTELYSRGDFAAAEKELSAAIELEPKAPDAYYNRGWAYRRQLKNRQAIADWTEAIQLYPFQASYFLSRANARIVEGDLSGGAGDASEAVALLPESSRGYFLRGVALLIQGEPQKALEDAVRALSYDPEYTDAKRLALDALIQREELIQESRAQAAQQKPGPARPAAVLERGPRAIMT